MTNSEFSYENANFFGESMFQGVQLVFEFMENHKDSITAVLPKPEVGYRDVCLKGLWSRAYFWMHSLARLNTIRDFQAAGASNRALLEIAVDLILLHNDKTNASGWKMYWWGLSEKLKAAEQAINYFRDKNIEIPETLAYSKSFILQKKGIIEEMRDKLWKSKKHPDRWTGNGNLFDDLIQADKSSANSIEEILRMPLAQYYRTEYRTMNWFIHSGTASFWDLNEEAFPLIIGFFLQGSGKLSLLCTKIVLDDFDLSSHLPNFDEQWQSVKIEQMSPLLRKLDQKISDNISE